MKLSYFDSAHAKSLCCHAMDGHPSKIFPLDCPRRIIGSLDQTSQPYMVHLTATNGPTLGMVFSKSVETNNWIRKD